MKTRVISATVLIVLVVGCFAISPITKALLMALIAVLAVHEMCNALSLTGTKCTKIILYIYAAAAAAAVYFKADQFISTGLFFLAVFAILSAGVLHNDIRGKGAISSLAVLVYPLVPILIVMDLALKDNWIPIFALGCISTWVCDSFALFGGKAFGKHKAAPEVSPNKTVEGCVCGALSAIVTGAILYFFLRDTYGLSLICCMVTGFVCSSFGQMGDLTASLIKRMVSLKDYSNLIPGHGGVMDRIDSLLFSIPCAYFCIMLFTM